MRKGNAEKLRGSGSRLPGYEEAASVLCGSAALEIAESLSPCLLFQQLQQHGHGSSLQAVEQTRRAVTTPGPGLAYPASPPCRRRRRRAATRVCAGGSCQDLCAGRGVPRVRTWSAIENGAWGEARWPVFHGSCDGNEDVLSSPTRAKPDRRCIVLNRSWTPIPTPFPVSDRTAARARRPGRQHRPPVEPFADELMCGVEEKAARPGTRSSLGAHARSARARLGGSSNGARRFRQDVCCARGRAVREARGPDQMATGRARTIDQGGCSWSGRHPGRKTFLPGAGGLSGGACALDCHQEAAGQLFGRDLPRGGRGAGCRGTALIRGVRSICACIARTWAP